MSSFPKIVAHIFLILQCLHSYGSYAKPELKEAYAKLRRSDSKSSVEWPLCGGTWISGDLLISAASCLGVEDGGKKKLSLKAEKDTRSFTVDVFTLLNRDSPPNEHGGIGVAHPLYKRDRSNRVPIAYDVAISKVLMIHNELHPFTSLCTEKETPRYHRYTAVAFGVNKTTEKTPENILRGAVHEYEIYGHSNIMSTRFNGDKYDIDPSKQFVTQLKNPHKNSDVYTAGGPVLSVFTKEPSPHKLRIDKCIMGIMSFSDGPIITSTKVDDAVIDWVDKLRL